jgi:hypothetical protein
VGSNLSDVPDSARCVATASRSGLRCRRAAISGARVCRSHGGAAPAVKRAAHQRAALARAVGLVGDDQAADPKRVLAATVTAVNAFLGGAIAALEAPDADQACLRQLGEAALLAARVSKLAMDARIEEKVAASFEQHGTLVAAMFRRVVGRAGLTQAQETALYGSLATELRALDGYNPEAPGGPGRVFEAEAEAATVEAELAARVLDQVDAVLPERVAGALAAGLSVLHLTDQDRERAAAAVERHLEAQAVATAEPLSHEQLQRQANAWTTGRGKGGRPS